MSNPIRRDYFTLPAELTIDSGFYQLIKEDHYPEQQFLPRLCVHNTSNNCDDVGVYDSELYQAIESGDIGFVTRSGKIRVALTALANHNTLLVTERCDNLCLFCSQPPKDIDDEWLLIQSAMAIAAFTTRDDIGISGGEPLLYGNSFLRFLTFLKTYRPSARLHILTNGRAFNDVEFAKSIALLTHEMTVTFGIPLYSSLSSTHDKLVGSSGAFVETLGGLINAGNLGINIELRIIPTQLNRAELHKVIELCSRSLSNVSQISIMNMEPVGWARKNWRDLYIDPSEYWDELRLASVAASRAGLPFFLFNYPLCHLPDDMRMFSVKSISDWKNVYTEECEGCSLIEQCGGFFASDKENFRLIPRRIL
ncbi:His-Xaa-Ser system radical SAM maturase HxsC [Litoribrevibacter albus]|uniref:His-Xaa-Ser system radical SAM maturase HxsC n=1 Tax=Litoribrevibacter albus TaxID=1473156 RepID=A0AA37W7R1_9GAMM|nr:His-Xaa-Ser system radical SAM maturase HxsC [Litoribrevibacter albus]GLQ30746.1 His-Xaa-Ser system radical SAM maturase HxsC [Litoribrevibacter albus]